ncbi:Inherit from KOG: PHOsphatase [Seminavis robusta]|uniref:Inherit from KOG: PHOsphatase n=1 Tax=Seminavis robusta TaxID=568900 RepID=A0A9N8E0Y0_9STRA|nr:Inherit from KOG: PHOsphatase [Seminavis robusta]|eukprot:Sro426_g140430.1 Inherit from KOG: PHOsphatase (275) ;mRNA; f:34717-35541
MPETKSEEHRIIKYPRTAHLFDAGGTATTTDDLVLPDLKAVVSTFCNGRSTVTIEEKVDGANLGISVNPQTHEIMIQNRSHYVSGHGGNHAQFNRLHEFTSLHSEALYNLLGDGNTILYGEWLVARHSIEYHRLPDIFVAFDLFDKTTGNFFSRQRFHAAQHGTCIPTVPVIEQRTFTRADAKGFRETLLRLLDTKSSFRTDGGPVEGIVLRIDTPPEEDANGGLTWLDCRYKVVRPDFVRGCGDGHWMKRAIEKQRVDYEFRERYLNECYSLR